MARSLAQRKQGSALPKPSQRPYTGSGCSKIDESNPLVLHSIFGGKDSQDGRVQLFGFYSFFRYFLSRRFPHAGRIILKVSWRRGQGIRFKPRVCVSDVGLFLKLWPFLCCRLYCDTSYFWKLPRYILEPLPEERAAMAAFEEGCLERKLSVQ